MTTNYEKILWQSHAKKKQHMQINFGKGTNLVQQIFLQNVWGAILTIDR